MKINIVALPSPKLILRERLQVVCVFAASILSALFSGFGSHVGTGPEVLFLVFLIGFSWFRPWPAALALFPILISIPPAPASVGLREVLVGSFLASLFVSSLWHYQQRTLALFNRSAVRATSIVLAVLVVVNFTVGHVHGVSVGDWVRGLLPFCFIAFCFPLAVLLTGEDRVLLMIVSVLTLSLLVAVWILYVYINNAEYRPFCYLLVGDYPKVPLEVAAAFKGPISETVFTRITGQVPFATDVSLPLGVVISAAIWVHSTRQIVRLCIITLAGLLIAAVMVTYTRSMLATIVVTLLIGVIVETWKRDWVSFRRWTSFIALISFVAVCVVAGFSIKGAWIGRLESMVSFGSGLSQSSPVPSSGERAQPTAVGRSPVASKAVEHPCGGQDCNLTSRVEEYRLAWNGFIAHPMTGRGLGEKHDIVMRSDEGDKVQHVGYIHNWVLYFLMSGGIPFFAAYSFLVFAPGIQTRRANLSQNIKVGLWTSTLLIVGYALFFAVFRLFTFNMSLAFIWAIPFSGWLNSLPLSMRNGKENGS